jgi:hypothetical protein
MKKEPLGPGLLKGHVVNSSIIAFGSPRCNRDSDSLRLLLSLSHQGVKFHPIATDLDQELVLGRIARALRPIAEREWARLRRSR